jgi:3-oxoacyl-[acyl-carrier-protein] synthase III
MDLAANANGPGLSILSVSSHRPPRRRVRELAGAGAADQSVCAGWTVTRIAADGEDSSGMGARALAHALRRAGISFEQLSLVVSCELSRDDLPSLPVVAEVIRVHELREACFRVDVTLGCLGALLGLEIARGWLRSREGGYAAVVTAERWTGTLGHSRPVESSRLGYSDGAAAAVVALARPGEPLGVYRGACFSTHPDVDDAEQIFMTLRERYRVKPDWLVCVQRSPSLVEILGEMAEVDPTRVCRTGETNGHMGAGDLLIGLEDLVTGGSSRGNVFLAASSPYAFGAGLIQV